MLFSTIYFPGVKYTQLTHEISLFSKLTLQLYKIYIPVH